MMTTSDTPKAVASPALWICEDCGTANRGEICTECERVSSLPLGASNPIDNPLPGYTAPNRSHGAVPVWARVVAIILAVSFLGPMIIGTIQSMLRP